MDTMTNNMRDEFIWRPRRIKDLEFKPDNEKDRSAIDLGSVHDKFDKLCLAKQRVILEDAIQEDKVCVVLSNSRYDKLVGKLTSSKIVTSPEFCIEAQFQTTFVHGSGKICDSNYLRDVDGVDLRDCEILGLDVIGLSFDVYDHDTGLTLFVGKPGVARKNPMHPY